MFVYPEINPIAISIGPGAIAWYGIMYLLGFIAAYVLAGFRVQQDWSPVTQEQVDDLIFYSVFGVILGGRLGYMIFYDANQLFSDPISWLIALPQLWNGGMSFHGGLLGVLFSAYVFARQTSQPFIYVIDFVAPLVPIGLGLGRIGNFINGELWGGPTDSPIGILVNGTIRHATQLYEATLEGLILFIILWIYTSKKRPIGFPSAVFLIVYGLFRIFIEFFRLPDAHIGYLFDDWLTLGQVLTLPMMIIGFWIIISHKLKVK